MLSFTEVTNIIKNESFDFDKEEIDEKSMEAIRIGTKINEDIWDDLVRLLNNSDLLSYLFEIPKEKVSKMSLNIRKYLDKVAEDDIHKNSKGKKFKLINTGSN